MLPINSCHVHILKICSEKWVHIRTNESYFGYKGQFGITGNKGCSPGLGGHMKTGHLSLENLSWSTWSEIMMAEKLDFAINTMEWAPKWALPPCSGGLFKSLLLSLFQMFPQPSLVTDGGLRLSSKFLTRTRSAASPSSHSYLLCRTNPHKPGMQNSLLSKHLWNEKLNFQLDIGQRITGKASCHRDKQKNN